VRMRKVDEGEYRWGVWVMLISWENIMGRFMV